MIFTFAPMNLLHYRVEFPPDSIQTLTVSYKQYAYKDTREPAGYQLAYVVHPASLWKEFGPINLEVAVPEGVSFKASVPCKNGGIEERKLPDGFSHRDKSSKYRFAIYQASLTEKTGELFLAVGADAWKEIWGEKTKKSPVQQQVRR